MDRFALIFSTRKIEAVYLNPYWSGNGDIGMNYGSWVAYGANADYFHSFHITDFEQISSVCM